MNLLVVFAFICVFAAWYAVVAGDDNRPAT